LISAGWLQSTSVSSAAAEAFSKVDLGSRNLRSWLKLRNNVGPAHRARNGRGP
jgi:hypothetical protein